jgi:hypothetical protein
MRSYWIKLISLNKTAKNNTRNLEQLVELTKKYYKKKRLNSCKKLNQLADKQEELSQSEKKMYLKAAGY